MQGAIVGLFFGCGLLVLARAFAPADRRLSTALNRLGAEPDFERLEAPKRWYSPLEPLTKHRWVSEALHPFEPDLAVVGRTPVDFAADIVARVGIGIAVAMVGTVLLPAVGVNGFAVPFGFGLLIGLGGAISAFVEVRVKAKERRQEFLEAMTAYMEFIRLGATFRGIDGSIWAGAQAGTGWAFDATLTAIEDARRYGEDSWTGLAKLGERFAVTELEELAATVSYSAVDGARVRDALEARTRSLRARLLAQEIAAAHSATTKLQGPIALIGVTVFALILIPAMANIAGA